MKRRGFTLIELLVVVAIIALLIAILLPSLGKARELSNRSVCAANVRGIGQSMAVYAKDNNDSYPIVSGVGGYKLAGQAGYQNTTATADAMLTSGAMYSSQAGSITQNMWILALTGQVAPKQFICKSDNAQTNAASISFNNKFMADFNNGNGGNSNGTGDLAYSYSFAYPWTGTGTIGGWWRDTTDAGLPLLSDMAPMGNYGGVATDTTAYTSKVSNSHNHQRDGQNVGFGDSHAEFTRSPSCGQSGDNIFTSCSGNFAKVQTGAAFSGGAVPGIGTGGSPGAYDVCLVPVADPAGTPTYQRK